MLFAKNIYRLSETRSCTASQHSPRKPCSPDCDFHTPWILSFAILLLNISITQPSFMSP